MILLGLTVVAKRGGTVVFFKCEEFAEVSI